ncbi:MAG: tetratricopeptide repeat protein, partial [Planctomycetota bacterium]
LALQRELLPSGHPEIATTLSNTGAMHRRAGNYAAAVPLLEEALAMREKVFPVDHPAVLTSQNMLAVSYQDQGRTKDALALARKVLAARRAKLGEHPQVAGSYYTIGSLLTVLEDHEAAEEHLRRSIAIYSATLPTDHLDRVRPMAFLGESFLKQSRVEDAIPLLEESLRVRRKLLSGDHPEVTQLEDALRRAAALGR